MIAKLITVKISATIGITVTLKLLGFLNINKATPLNPINSPSSAKIEKISSFKMKYANTEIKSGPEAQNIETNEELKFTCAKAINIPGITKERRANIKSLK